jgi:hypothetical protein
MGTASQTIHTPQITSALFGIRPVKTWTDSHLKSKVANQHYANRVNECHSASGRFEVTAFNAGSQWACYIKQYEV